MKYLIRSSTYAASAEFADVSAAWVNEVEASYSLSDALSKSRVWNDFNSIWDIMNL